jgi:hypothetical protein
MSLLSAKRQPYGKVDQSSDEDPDPKRAKEKKIKFEKKMSMVDLEIN